MLPLNGTNFVQDLAGFGLAAFAPFEILRKISQNFSPAGVTSPFEARAMPTDPTSVVPLCERALRSRVHPARSGPGGALSVETPNELGADKNSPKNLDRSKATITPL